MIRYRRINELIWFSDIYDKIKFQKSYNVWPFWMICNVSWGILENSLNLSILLSERKEIKRDVLSSGERNGHLVHSRIRQGVVRICAHLKQERKKCFWIIIASVLDWWISLEVIFIRVSSWYLNRCWSNGTWRVSITGWQTCVNLGEYI